MQRRQFVQSILAAPAASWTLGRHVSEAHTGVDIHLAPFRFDVTPPRGHSCCGGWITPVVDVDDPLQAIGFVLLGAGRPIVICAVDWTGLLNESHLAWRHALASAAGTTPDRVAVQCVHQHNAPFSCLEAQRIVAAQGDLPSIIDPSFHSECLERGQSAVSRAITSPISLTHVSTGEARVDRVASNRRVFRDENGRVRSMRGSSCRNPTLRALPEGTVDPMLKSISFFHGETKIAACHYYAVHPMSYYGDGRVTSDFVGLARRQRQREEPQCTHVYFTGCAGNIAAGKYNDGSPQLRAVLARRIYQAIVAAEAHSIRRPLSSLTYRSTEILPGPRKHFDAQQFEKQISQKDLSIVSRNRPAFMLSWMRRLAQKQPIILSGLDLNEASMIHLPGECFVQYQLRAQKSAPDRFVATAAYGDGGIWYVPVKEEYDKGGYETSVAFSDPSIDAMLTDGIGTLLHGA